MEEIILNLNSFLESYILGSAIESITFDNQKCKWIIKYGYNVEDDEFEDAESMVKFLKSDQ